MSGISVVIPVYNAGSNLPRLIERLEPVLVEIGADFELIFVDDDSADGSWSELERITAEYPRARALRLMRNYGQHNAILCGIRDAKLDLVVTMDDDLQHPPEELPKLLAALRDDLDVVYGAPDVDQHGWFRNLSSQVTKLVLAKAMGADTARKVSAFRVFRRHLLDAFHHYESPFVSIDVLLTWATTRFTAIRVRHEPRLSGESNYTIGKLLRHALDMMTGFSVLPLQVATLLGFALTLFGIGVIVYVVGRYLIEGVSVPGFAFLASTIAIFSGSQLFALGIIGEYLARIHFRTMGRPAYSVRERLPEQKD